jgi:hypothetical protein
LEKTQKWTAFRVALKDQYDKEIRASLAQETLSLACHKDLMYGTVFSLFYHFYTQWQCY